MISLTWGKLLKHGPIRKTRTPQKVCPARVRSPVFSQTYTGGKQPVNLTSTRGTEAQEMGLGDAFLARSHQ